MKGPVTSFENLKVSKRLDAYSQAILGMVQLLT